MKVKDETGENAGRAFSANILVEMENKDPVWLQKPKTLKTEGGVKVKGEGLLDKGIALLCVWHNMSYTASSVNGIPLTSPVQNQDSATVLQHPRLYHRQNEEIAAEITLCRHEIGHQI